jgi:sucrose-phosphate synthase
MILAIARPYAVKNITTLVKAFGECHPLRELANLVRIVLQLICYCYLCEI